jgi:hypothetical protein
VDSTSRELDGTMEQLVRCNRLYCRLSERAFQECNLIDREKQCRSLLPRRLGMALLSMTDVLRVIGVIGAGARLRTATNVLACGTEVGGEVSPFVILAAACSAKRAG